MEKIDLPFFGNTNLKEDKDLEYRFEARKWNFNFEGKPVDLDVHFKEIDEQKIKSVSSALKKLNEIAQIGQKAIQANFEEGEVVKEYIEEWNEDIFFQIFEKDEFQKFIEHTNKENDIEERLLSLIRIVRIGFYAESESSFVTIDFAFGYDQEKGFRDYMLVITLNPDLKVTDICAEG